MRDRDRHARAVFSNLHERGRRIAFWFLDVHDTVLPCGPRQEVLRPLVDEVPAEVGKRNRRMRRRGGAPRCATASDLPGRVQPVLASTCRAADQRLPGVS